MNTPREKRHEQVRRRILDAARHILAEEGLDALSMRLLAEKIDYSPAAIYKYFHSKQEILQAIREEYWQFVFERRERIDLRRLTPPEQLYAIARAYIETAETYPQHYLLMFNAGDAPAAQVALMEDDPRLAGMVDIIKRGIEEGYFHLPQGYTPELLALQNWITTHGMIMLKLTVMREMGEDFDRLCDRIIRNSIRAIQGEKKED